MEKSYFKIFVLSVGVILPSVLGETLVIYEHVGRQGDSLQLTVEGCTKFPTRLAWNDKVSSIDNGGRCITLHENGDCTGKFIDLLPGDSKQYDLFTAKFDDMASSASPCTRAYRGAYVEDGDYYIESAEDDSALTTEPQVSGKLVSRVVLEDAVDKENQQWSIKKNPNSVISNGYFVTSKVHHSNIVTTNIRSSGEPKNIWHFLPGLGGKMMIFRHTPLGGKICLKNAGYGNEIGQTFCENNSRSQQWILRKVNDPDN